MSDGFDLNGIEAARGGRVLLAVQTQTGCCGESTRPRARTGPSTSAGPSSPTATGCCCSAATLLVVRNRLNQIAVVRLDRGFASGRVVRTITNPDFEVPTTVARKRGSLYLPNARFSYSTYAGDRILGDARRQALTP